MSSQKILSASCPHASVFDLFSEIDNTCTRFEKCIYAKNHVLQYFKFIISCDHCKRSFLLYEIYLYLYSSILSLYFMLKLFIEQKYTYLEVW